MKKLLLSSLFIIPVVAMQEQVLQIESPALQYPSQLGSLKLYHHNNRFIIDDNGNFKEIQRCDIDPEIRTLPKEKILAYLATGYLRANKANNGDIILRAHQRIHGGGFGGAAFGVWLGKAIVYGVSYGTLAVATAGATLIAGPAGTGAMYGVSLACAPFIEAASNVVAVGTGIAGAVATGPV